MNRLPLYLLFFASSSLFAETCPTYDDVSDREVGEALALIEPRMAQCQDDAVANGVYGGLLLRSGQIESALIWLERSLLIDPEQPGVQADYAIGLAAQGDRFSSQAIASQLLTMDSVPNTLTGVLTSLTEVNRWTAEVSASIGTGYSTNIDFVPSMDALDLTFGDDGVASVPLAEATSPDAAGFFQQSMALGMEWQGVGYRVLPGIRVVDRSASGSESSDYVSTRGVVQIVDPEAERLVSFGYGLLNYGGEQDRTEWRLGYGERLGTLANGCRVTGTADWVSQAYGASSANDTRIYQAGVSADCPNRWFWMASVGLDLPVNDRLGGDRTRFSGAIGQTLPVEMGEVTVSAGLSREIDQDTYSEFLDYGSPRTITTFELGATWQIPMTQNLLLSTELGVIRQSSNISLFDATASEISVNMIYIP